MEKKIYGIESFLSRPMELEEEIRRDIDHIASLRSIVEKTTTHLSFTAGRNPSKNEKAFENVMIQISEEEASLAEKQKQLVECKMEVENLINCLPKQEHRELLRYKYLEGLEMSEIRDVMLLAKSTGYDLLSNAMASAEQYLHFIKN